MISSRKSYLRPVTLEIDVEMSGLIATSGTLGNGSDFEGDQDWNSLSQNRIHLWKDED